MQIENVKKYCTGILTKDRCSQLQFHNFNHTLEVVIHCKEIGVKSGLSKENLKDLIIAAWFHDTGFDQKYFGHEEVSKLYAQQFLMLKKYDPERIHKILGCINATKLSQTPNSLLEQIICDADLFHLSTYLFFQRMKLLREEWYMFLNRSFSDMEWYKLNLDFLQNHYYQSPYGKKFLEGRKMVNIEKLRILM